jgi:hypothetical protein
MSGCVKRKGINSTANLEPVEESSIGRKIQKEEKKKRKRDVKGVCLYRVNQKGNDRKGRRVRGNVGGS